MMASSSCSLPFGASGIDYFLNPGAMHTTPEDKDVTSPWRGAPSASTRVADVVIPSSASAPAPDGAPAAAQTTTAPAFSRRARTTLGITTASSPLRAASSAPAQPRRGSVVVRRRSSRPATIESLEVSRLLWLLCHDPTAAHLRGALPGHNALVDPATGKRTALCPAEGCSCSANPVTISGNVRETHMHGPSSERLCGWVMRQRNSRGELYADLWGRFQAEVRLLIEEALRRMGVAEEHIASLEITSEAFLENNPRVDKALYRAEDDQHGLRLFAGGGAAGISRPETNAQAGHVDGGEGTVQAIVAMLDGTDPTRLFRGEHKDAAYALRRFHRSSEEEAAFNRYVAANPEHLAAMEGCHSLALPRDELEQRIAPACEGTLSAGDAVVLLGDEIHGGPAVPAGRLRLVLFVSGVMRSYPGARAYPVDSQTTPWVHAFNAFSSKLFVEHCLEYRHLDPLRNFGSSRGDAAHVKKLRQALTAVVNARRERQRREAEQGKRQRVDPEAGASEERRLIAMAEDVAHKWMTAP